MDKASDMDSRCRPVSTQIFTERAINPKFDGITTEEMVRELVDRKQAHVDQLSAVVALFDAPPAHRPLAKTEGRPRPVPALPPAPPAEAAAPPATAPDGSSLNERIVAVLLAAEGRGLRSREITERLLAAGWTTKSPDKGKMVSSALSGMVAKKALKRRGDLLTLPTGQEATSASAVAPAKKKRGASKKTAAPKSAPPKKGKAPVRPPAGQQVADFVLAALVEAAAPSKPGELIPRMKRAGWTSAAKNAEKMIENTLRKLVAKKKAKSLGSRTFQATGG
jgi:hypothetical protein